MTISDQNTDIKARASDKNSLKTSKIRRKPRDKKPPKLTHKQEQILAIRNDNPKLTNQEIADSAKTSPGYVADVLIRYGLNKEAIDDYNSNKGDIWGGITSRILSKVSDEDIQKASLHQKLTAAGIAFDKHAILTGTNRDVQPMVIINQIRLNQDKTQVEGLGSEGQIIDVCSVVNNAQCPEIESLKNKPLDIIRESTESK
jgi:hypothetical protein